MKVAVKKMANVIEYVPIHTNNPYDRINCLQCDKLCFGYWYVNKMLRIKKPLPFCEECFSKENL